jgi:hypothetical protein
MIKFDLFDETSSSYQCHFNQIGTFVVSISHYMRAYFNYLAISHGRDFSLPSDAGYLNCVALKNNGNGDDGDDASANDAADEAEEDDGNYGNGNNQRQLYVKIGCMERETFTSTRLQLHVYKDAQCSVAYDDGLEGRTHSNKGYDIDGVMFSTRVSFRPPFFTCQSCAPDAISETFNKKYGTWYDDDYISRYGEKRKNNNGEEEENEAENGNDDAASDDAAANNDDNNNKYNRDDGYIDDTYMSANDDIYNYNNKYQSYNYNKNSQYSYTDDYNNGGGRDLRRRLSTVENNGAGELQQFVPAAGELEVSFLKNS